MTKGNKLFNELKEYCIKSENCYHCPYDELCNTLYDAPELYTWDTLTNQQKLDFEE